MSERLDKIIPDFSDLSLESIWEKYSDAAPAPSPSAERDAPEPAVTAATTAAPAGDVPTAGSIADRSRRIVMNALGETLRQYRQRSAEPSVSSGPDPEDLFSFEEEPALPTPAVIEPEAVPDTYVKDAVPPEDEFTENDPDAASDDFVRDDIPPDDAPDESSSHEDDPIIPDTSPAEADAPGQEQPAESGSAEDALSDPPPAPERPRPRVTVGADGIITLLYGPASDEGSPSDGSSGTQAGAAQDVEAEAVPPEEAAAGGSAPTVTPIGATVRKAQSTARRKAKAARRRVKASVSETILTPAVRLIAAHTARRQQQKKESAAWPEPEDIHETPELSLKAAARYYSTQSKQLQLRLRVSLLLTIILAWIALGLPMSIKLSQSLPLQAGLSLILTLTVMLAALDIVSAGLRQLCELAPGPESLAALSALLSCVDAALTLTGYGTALPFCAVGAAALTAALWGERLRCRALMRTFRTAASSKDPSYMASDHGDDKTPPRILRTDDPPAAGIVRRSEQHDICRTVYTTAAPFMILAALVFSAIASVTAGGQFFLHTLSALLSVSASFAAFFGFSLPWSVAARRLRSSGAAVAGFAGCTDIAHTREIVITDSDLFPPGSMRFSAINVLEGMPQHKVIIAAASLIFTSGGGASDLFEELVERRGYNVPEPREYSVHESGGLSGVVNGEHVDVGPARFMNLQGIRLPRNLPAKNAVCIAISGELVGVFQIEYTPFTSVQDALVILLRGRFAPLFAVRDFNITPKMVHDLFKLPSTNFHFPSYRARSRIRLEAGSPADAVITRKGMLPYVESAEAGRRLYSTSRIVTILSLIGSSIGMVILFLLCRTAAFDTASVGNALSFMLLWALPAVILSYSGGK